jgi:CBS domain containing-hemolysin-like protein
MEWLGIIAIFFCCILIGLLTGIETAFIAVNKFSLELKKKQGGFSATLWGRLADNPVIFVASLIVSLNVLLVIYGLMIGDMLLPVWHWIERQLPEYTNGYVKFIRLFTEIFLSTIIIVLCYFFFAEIFRARKNSILNNRIVSAFSSGFYWFFASLAQGMMAASEWILKYIFNVKVYPQKDRFTKVDLDQFVQQRTHQDEEHSSALNKELFENAMNLSETKLRECLIPRKEVEGIEMSTPLSAIKEKFIETKLSRLVVYEKNIDNIKGYIHHLDLFQQPASIMGILHKIPTVPETMSATNLMNVLSKERKSMAWVVDEFGGTAGIITMEDLLEEIFGEIDDEYDVPEAFVEKQIATDEFIFSGRLELDYLQEKYELQFENPESAETLSGYIININQGIPAQKKNSDIRQHGVHYIAGYRHENRNSQTQTIEIKANDYSGAYFNENRQKCCCQ